VPGPSNLFLLAHGIGHGRRAALAATSGIAIASAVRVLLTAAGLSALLACSAVAFNVIRWAGVAYLVYLGIRTFRSGMPEGPRDAPAREVSLAHSVRKGLLVGLGNPKMVIFFLAFFPQFVHPSQGSEMSQILVLGAVFWVIGAAWDLAFAGAAGKIGAWLQRRPAGRTAQHRFEGVAYFGLAGGAAVSSSRTSH
jgi:threonine/homoserine/homoserine lactone efflux protein